MMSASKKLGVVTVSSTEIMIVVDGERFPTCSWFKHFWLAQEDSSKEDTLMQDNESAISLHEHHLFSVVKVNNNANVRYFFVLDKTIQKEVMIAHCPTAKMVAAFSTKPLQGNASVIHRNTM